MRISDNMTYDQVRGTIGKNRSQMTELQNQAATQKRVTRPSDDPMAAARVLHSRVDLEGNKQFIKNLNYARSFLETTDQAMADITENLMRLKELAINQANDASASDESRRVVSAEVEQVFNQLVNIGNRKLGDRFVFGGFHTQNAPFDFNGEYKGDEGEMLVHIDKSTFLPMNMAGNRLFHGVGLSPKGLSTPTPEQPQTVEEFRQERGIDEKSNPSANPSSNPNSNPNSSAPVELRTPASVNESKDYAESESEPKNAEPLGVNLFKVTKDLMIALRTNDKAGVQDSLDQMDEAIGQVVLARAQVGSRSTAVDGLLQSLERSKVDDQTAISQHEDADVFSTVSDLNKTESTLQATLQTSGKMIQPSLLNFLR